MLPGNWCIEETEEHSICRAPTNLAHLSDRGLRLDSMFSGVPWFQTQVSVSLNSLLAVCVKFPATSRHLSIHDRCLRVLIITALLANYASRAISMSRLDPGFIAHITRYYGPHINQAETIDLNNFVTKIISDKNGGYLVRWAPATYLCLNINFSHWQATSRGQQVLIRNFAPIWCATGFWQWLLRYNHASSYMSWLKLHSGLKRFPDSSPKASSSSMRDSPYRKHARAEEYQKGVLLIRKQVFKSSN